MSSRIPIEGHNTYYLQTTPTQYFINILNPYHPMWTMAITIEYPLMPSTPDPEIETPTFVFADFQKYCGAFDELLEDEENSKIYPFYKALEEIAIEMVRIQIVRNEKNWRWLVSLYIAHFLTLVIQDLKDEKYINSMNPSVDEKKLEIDKLEANKNQWLITPYGYRFWSMYEPIGRRFMIGGRRL